MNEKLAIVLASGDPEVLEMGMMYALNSIKQGWMKEVRVFFFGPSEVTIPTDPRLRELLAGLIEAGAIPMACKFCSDKHEISERLLELGCDVAYVGAPISEAIRDGFVPMVW